MSNMKTLSALYTCYGNATKTLHIKKHVWNKQILKMSNYLNGKHDIKFNASTYSFCGCDGDLSYYILACYLYSYIIFQVLQPEVFYLTIRGYSFVLQWLHYFSL